MSQYFRLTIKYEDENGEVQVRDDLVDKNEQGLAQFGLQLMHNGLAFKSGNEVKVVPPRFIRHATVKPTILRPEEAKRVNVPSLNDEIGKKK